MIYKHDIYLDIKVRKIRDQSKVPYLCFQSDYYQFWNELPWWVEWRWWFSQWLSTQFWCDFKVCNFVIYLVQIYLFIMIMQHHSCLQEHSQVPTIFWLLRYCSRKNYIRSNKINVKILTPARVSTGPPPGDNLLQPHKFRISDTYFYRFWPALYTNFYTSGNTIPKL